MLCLSPSMLNSQHADTRTSTNEELIRNQELSHIFSTAPAECDQREVGMKEAMYSSIINPDIHTYVLQDNLTKLDTVQCFG